MSRFGAWPWIVCAVAFGMMVFGSLTREHGPGRLLLLEFCERWERVAAEPVERRVALHGELLDAGAGAHYREAMRQAQAIFARPRDATNEQLAVRAERLAVMVAEVRAAVDSRLLNRPFDGVTQVWSLWWGLRESIERSLTTGDDAQGVSVWLDAVALMIDWGQSVHDGWTYVVQVGKAEAEAFGIWTTARLDHLDTDLRAELADGLAVLEQRLTSGGGYERFLAHSGRCVTAATYDGFRMVDDWQAKARDHLAAWRDGFSPQNAAIRELATLVAALPSLPPSDAPWPEFARSVAELAGSGIRARQLLDYEAARREALARIRLLRQALASRAGQPDDLHVDPFTGRAFDRETCGDHVYFVARHPGGDVHTHANLRAPAARR